MIAQFARRAGLMNAAFVHQGDARATLCFVEIWRGNNDRNSLARKIRQRVPEFPPRDRIDAGSRLVQQQNLRFNDQCAGE